LGSQNRVAQRRDAIALARLRQLGVDPSRRICWFAGTFGQSYDLATVIEAAREFQRRGIVAPQFVLCGAGEQDTALRERARDLGNVVFTGWVASTQLEAIGACAWVGLQPYRADARQGFANKLFEYLSFGLPLVSSLAGENAALISEHSIGATYAAGDAGALFETLNTLLADDPSVAGMSARARRLFEERFSSDSIYQRLAAHLERLAGPSGPQQPQPVVGAQ
jgi:glycosyltransferase involved in cell wall biosynthesis